MEHQTMDAIENVTIKLSADGGDNPDTIIFPDRQVSLTRGNAALPIGRSSKVSSKGFIASKDTAWFDNQVMSRSHAEISADLENKKVNIRDTGSLHGTYLNDIRLSKDNLAELKDGDKLRFGISVLRGQDSFAPTCVKVGITYGPPTPKRATTPDNAFKVPDDSVISDDEENSASEDETSTNVNLPQPNAGFPSNSIDLTQPLSSKTDYRTIIDITSPVGSPDRPINIADSDSDCAVMDNSPSEAEIVSLHSASPDLGENERRQNETATLANVWDGHLDNSSLHAYDAYLLDVTDCDDESIRLSTDDDDEDDDDEDMSDSEVDQMDTSSDDDSDIEILDDEFDSELERELQSELEWEAEYSSGDEVNDEAELDELPKWKVGVAPKPEVPFYSPPSPRVTALVAPSPILEPSVTHYEAAEASSSELPNTSIMPSSILYSGIVNQVSSSELPSVPSPNLTKKTAAVSIEELLNSTLRQDTLAPPPAVPLVAIASSMTSRTVRLPSPSDAALAKSFAPNDDGSSSDVDTLGMKTGKFEFFAAREENKSKAAKMGDSQNEAFEAEDAPHNDHPAHGPFSIEKQVSPPPFPTVMGSDGVPGEPIQPLAHSEWYDRGASFLRAPLPPPSELSGGLGFDDEEAAMTSAYTFQQHKRRQRGAQTSKSAQAPARTYVGISDIVDSCQSTPKEHGKGKRKAGEISMFLTPAERQFEASGKKSEPMPTHPSTPPSTSTEALVTPPPTVESGAVPRSSQTFSPELPHLPQLPDTSSQVSRTDRPIKRRRLRKIVERVGYAALGGVTVGAMVVGSLIYTAPTF